MDIYNTQRYSIDMVFSECGLTGLWFSAHKVGFPYLLPHGYELGLLDYARLPINAQCGLHMSQVCLVESFLAQRGVFHK